LTKSFQMSWNSILLRLTAGALMVATLPVNAQVTTAADSAIELHQLRSELDETRNELSRAQSQIGQLAKELQALRREFDVRAPLPAEAPVPPAAFPSAADLARQAPPGGQNLPESVAELIANQKLLAAQLDEQHQTKVESESKYRVKLSGIILMNAYSNRGAFDVADLPKLVLDSPSKGSVGASVRQSIIGLQVLGPDLAGATTSASISADFFGGFPAQQPYGTSLGILRLRQASAHLGWTNTSLTVGQDGLFFSPLSPTSYASLAEPALSYAGNLWAWTPQVVAEHRFHTSSQTFFSVSGGILAPLADSVSSYGGGFPGPGELARRPAFGSQVGFDGRAFGQPLAIGIVGYASHLKYGPGRETDSWAVTGFWRVPLGHLFELSGEAYRGKAVGGIGGGIWQSVVYDGNPATASTRFRPLNSLGGWSQVKFHPHPKWELNSAIGQDSVFAKDLEWAPNLVGAYIAPTARNRAAFGNMIFRPRSNLLLSVEYRKIWTYGYDGEPYVGDHVNVGAGVSF